MVPDVNVWAMFSALEDALKTAYVVGGYGITYAQYTNTRGQLLLALNNVADHRTEDA